MAFHAFSIARLRHTLAGLLLICAASVGAAPGYEDLTPDQLEQYARARNQQHSHEEAMDYATKPIPKSRDELTPDQQEMYDVARNNGGLSDADALDYATQPPGKGPSYLDDLDRVDAQADANHQAAADARARAAQLRGDAAVPDAGESCGPDVPGLLAQFDEFTRTGDQAGHAKLWNSLSPDVQRQVLNLQAARDASDDEWFATSGLDRGDWGVAWAAESGALMNGAAQAGGATSLVQRGRDYYGPVIARLEEKQRFLGSELLEAQQQAKTFADNLKAYRDGTSWYMFGDTPRETFLDQGLVAANKRVESLTSAYVLTTEELENTQRAAASYDKVAQIADLKANATARTQEEDKRALAAFDAAQALRQQNAEILTGQMAFRDAKTALTAKIEQARTDGRDSSADQWEVDLGYLEMVETDWVAMQTHIAQGLQGDLDNLLAQNAADGIGPTNGIELANAIVSRGMTPTLDPEQLQQVQTRIAIFAGGVQNNRAYELDWRDILLTYSDSFDEAVVAPWELVNDPVGSISGNLRFWRRYGSFWYGVALAAKDGIVDIVVLSTEALDTLFEIDQGIFNATFGTEIDWFGNENLQFIAQAKDLTPDKIAEITDQITDSINRRIEQNAGSGNVNQMLTDTGYVVGTIVGAEEGAIRAVVIVTKYGKVLVKGKQVEKLLDSVADAEKARGLVAADGLDEIPISDSMIDVDPFSAPSPSRANPVAAPSPIAKPVIPGLINTRGGQMTVTQRPYIDGTTGAHIKQLDEYSLEYPPYSIKVGRDQYIGHGSTTRAYTSRDPNFIIKITEKRGAAGILVDNYGYKVLDDAVQGGRLDLDKVRVPIVKEQFPTNGGGVVSIVERGPDTAWAVIANNGGQLNQGMRDAIRAGVDELAGNSLVLADFKLDNIGLEDLGNGRYRMWILDPGSVLYAKSPEAAASFFKDIIAPSDDMLRAIENIPGGKYMDMVNKFGKEDGLSATEIAEARVILAKVLAKSPTFFDRPVFPRTAAGELASDAFNWTRVNEQKSLLASKYDPELDFGHFQQGTGLDVGTLAPGGLTYNPAVGRQAPGLRMAFVDAADSSSSGFIGSEALTPSSSNPFKLGSDLSSDSSVLPPLGFRLGASPNPAPGGVPFMVHVPGRLADEFTTGIGRLEIGPYFGRRLIIGATRLARSDCDSTIIFRFGVAPNGVDAFRDQVASLPGVGWVELDSARSEQIAVDDPLFDKGPPPQQWALRDVGLSAEALAAAARETPARDGVVVAVIDTGVAWGHRDLNARDMWINRAEIPGNGIDDDRNGYIDDIVGWNFINDNNLPWDTDGHGTLVAGVIGASSANGVGIAGINPHARIMALRALDGEGKGLASHTAEAIVYAVDNGAQIINLSLGGRGMTRAEELALEHAQHYGVLVVAAAGNDGIDLSDWGPTVGPGVIAVGASSAERARIAQSNFGGRLDLVAPGVDVVSLRAPGTDLMAKFENQTPLAQVVGEDRAYYRASGTSFAAPIVTGVASLIKQRNPGLTAVQIRRMLTNSATDIGEPGRDVATGYGLLDAPRALEADPAFFVDAALASVRVSQSEKGTTLDVYGTADADQLADAKLELGKGEAPTSWQKAAPVSPMVDGVLARIPANTLAGSPQWTLRLTVKHKNGREREARFLVKLQ